jgi:hypothetical protein
MSERQSTPQNFGVAMVLMPVWPPKIGQFWLVK